LERNLYRVLAVAPDATTDEIERSFRQLARRAHPDLNGGDGAAVERMKELNIARATLTDPAARAAYDERLRVEQRAKAAATAQPAAPRPTPPPPAATPRSTAKPFLAWARTRDVPPPAATPSSEIRPLASVGRLAWLGFLSVLGLAAVLLIIWLRETLLDP
jgi:curved DNA-binding protein CbpA